MATYEICGRYSKCLINKISDFFSDQTQKTSGKSIKSVTNSDINLSQNETIVNFIEIVQIFFDRLKKWIIEGNRDEYCIHIQNIREYIRYSNISIRI